LVVIDVNILWIFLGSALVVLMQAQALRLAKTNRDLAASEHALRVQNAELDNANARLSELDELKSRFLAGITQELNRPLGSLLSQIDLLRRHYGQDPSLVHRVSLAVADEGEQLERLIASLKERASNDMFRMEWSETQVDAAAMLEEAVATMRSVASRRKVDIRCAATPDVSPVWAHRDRFVHGLVLLIDSAVTHAPEGGIVEAEVIQAGPEVVYRVVQRGGEILTKEKIDEILSEKDQRRTGEPQTGFAFKLCRDIVANHRGRFWIDTESTSGGRMICFVAMPAVHYERRAAAYAGADAAADVAGCAAV
jgi:signal transduction histidine kinase